MYVLSTNSSCAKTHTQTVWEKNKTRKHEIGTKNDRNNNSEKEKQKQISGDNWDCVVHSVLDFIFIRNSVHIKTSSLHQVSVSINRNFIKFSIFMRTSKFTSILIRMMNCERETCVTFALQQTITNVATNWLCTVHRTFLPATLIFFFILYIFLFSFCHYISLIKSIWDLSWTKRVEFSFAHRKLLS